MDLKERLAKEGTKYNAYQEREEEEQKAKVGAKELADRIANKVGWIATGVVLIGVFILNWTFEIVGVLVIMWTWIVCFKYAKRLTKR